MKKVLTTRLVMMTLTLIAIMCIGCGGDDALESSEEKMLENAATDLLGAMKTPEAVAMAPQAPGVGVPFVKEVGYYGDWKLTKPLTGAVAAGKTIYIKVVFSEDMTVVVADDKTARPILFRQIDGALTRFHIVQYNTKLGDGDAKHRGKDAATFVCKYVVQPEDTGKFTVAVGKHSTDTDNIGMAAFYRHKENLQLGDTEPPTVTSVTYWRDADGTDPIEDTVHPGADIYTKIVFSEAMQVVKRGQQSFPVLYYEVVGRGQVRYRIVDSALQHGDAVTQDGVAFICRNTIPADTIGVFRIRVGKKSKDRNGNPMDDVYVSEGVRIELEPVVEDNPVVSEPRKPVTRTDPITPDNAEQRALEIAKKVSRAQIQVAAKASHERHINFAEDWEAALATIAKEEGVAELSNDLTIDMFYIYLHNSPHPMTDYVEGNKRFAPSLILAYFRIRFLNPGSTQEAVLEMFTTDVRNGTIRVFLM